MKLSLCHSRNQDSKRRPGMAPALFSLHSLEEITTENWVFSQLFGRPGMAPSLFSLHSLEETTAENWVFFSAFCHSKIVGACFLSCYDKKLRKNTQFSAVISSREWRENSYDKHSVSWRENSNHISWQFQLEAMVEKLKLQLSHFSLQYYRGQWTKIGEARIIK